MNKKEDSVSMDRLAQLWSRRAKGLIAEMNLQIEEATYSGVTIRMTFNPNFCVDEEETLLHGGALTALLDSAFGLANLMAIGDVQTMATLDLRVEYLRPAQTRADVLVSAECYRQTRHIAFCSGKVWHDGAAADEIARGSATFALTRGKSGLLEMMEKMGAQ